MAVSQVTISNIALTHLGQETITDPNDPTTRAIVIKQRFEGVRDRLLRSHVWRFAVTRGNFASDATPPEYTWGYRYEVPAEVLRMLRIEPYYEPWIREGRYILTNVSGPLNVQFIRRVINPSEFDESFNELLGLEIAIAVCVRLTNSRDLLIEVLAPLKQELLYEARSTGAMEGYPEEIDDGGSWINARH